MPTPADKRGRAVKISRHLSFDSGALWGESGHGLLRQFGVLRDVQIDFEGTDDLALPMAIKDGQCKISGNAKVAQIYSDILGGLISATFRATFYNPDNGLALCLAACRATKPLPAKFGTWTIGDLDFSAFADHWGTMGYLATVD